MSSKQPGLPCPCGGASYATCCAPFIDGAAPAPTAEQLMRSRYTAYARRDEAYLRATWHASTRPSEPIVDADEKLQWLGLEIKTALRLRQRHAELPQLQEEHHAENQDSVEFVARYKVNGKAHRLHEISRFVREDGRWFYVDGSFPA